MWVSEWLATGKRRCKCEDVKLVIRKEEYQQRIRRHKDIMVDTLNAMAGISKYRTKRVWKAVCSKCGVSYLICSTKKELLRHIEISEIKAIPDLCR